MRTARPEPSGFAAKAKDLQALRDAVDQAATVSGALWLSYIFVFLYLAIAAGAVTHKDLFFENPVKLPFLNVELPLIGFFVLGPALFLIVHAYTLLHFAMLAGKVGAFHTELEAQIPLHRTATGCAGNCRATSSCSSWPVRATSGTGSWASCCG